MAGLVSARMFVPLTDAESSCGRRDCSSAWAAGAHVALDAVPRAEQANILGADFESEGFEMRPDVASSVGLAGIPQHEEQGVQLPTVLVPEGSPTSRLVVVIFKKAERFGEIAEQSLTP